jgi:sarcosine oxidase/L-pipecolate oxidase
VFPDTWKIAKVAPVYKSGDKTCIDNYRSISVLPVLSKILERHVTNHLYEYLTKYNLVENQSGFRKCHSTETLLVYLTDIWLKEMCLGNLNGVLLIDFRKAFDMHG